VSDHADFHYKCTDYYSPKDERILRWDDPQTGIYWPMPISLKPLVAARDAAGLGFSECEKFPADVALGRGFPARSAGH
jgi:dTDP-4-dehydrorhamnose 3,5-epimerase